MPTRGVDVNARGAVSPRESNSGSGTAILLVLLGLVFILGPFMVPQSVLKLPVLSQIIISGFGVLMLGIGGVMFTITQLYEKATMNVAFVRTGVGGPKVVQDGAAIVIPAIHRLTWVSLETIRLEIGRLGAESFITGDSLHVDVKAQFYIRVNRTPDAIMAAATSLGGKSGDDSMIMELVGDKLISGLRTVAGRRELDFLHAHVDEYSEEVKKIVETDIEHNGLFLESVTVTYLNQTPISNLKPEENIFDAQGAKKISSVTNAARVEIAKTKSAADREVREQEVARDQEIFSLNVKRATTEAETQVATKNAQAQSERQAAEFAAEQNRLAKIAAVNATQAVEVAGVEKEQAVQLAQAEQEKTVQAAQIAKDQAVQTATVVKERTIEVARRDREIAVAAKGQELARADAERIGAETEKTRKEQEKLTVEAKATAERQKDVAVVAKQAMADQSKIERNMEADVSAYATVKQATAEQEAAAARAEALRVEAQGKKDAATLEAAGDQAKQLVPVEVARTQVEVDQKRVADVLTPELTVKSANAKMSFDLQVKLAEIEAEKQVKIEAAKAAGAGFAAANITIYGDPETFARMMTSFTSGQQQGEYVRGLIDKTPAQVTQTAFATADAVTSFIAGLANKYLGKDIPHSVIAEAVKAEMAKTSNHSPVNGPAA